MKKFCIVVLLKESSEPSAMVLVDAENRDDAYVKGLERINIFTREELESGKYSIIVMCEC